MDDDSWGKVKRPIDDVALDELAELACELDGAERRLAESIGSELSGSVLLERAKLDLERLARGDFDRLLESRLFKRYVRVKNLREEVRVGAETLRPGELGRALDFIVAGSDAAAIDGDPIKEAFEGCGEPGPALADRLAESPSVRYAFAVGHEMLCDWEDADEGACRPRASPAVAAAVICTLAAAVVAGGFAYRRK